VLCVLSAYAEGRLRLEASEAPYEGRLEIYHDGAWGTICSHGFDNRDATVACRNLGLGLVVILLRFVAGKLVDIE